MHRGPKVVGFKGRHNEHHIIGMIIVENVSKSSPVVVLNFLPAIIAFVM